MPLGITQGVAEIAMQVRTIRPQGQSTSMMGDRRVDATGAAQCRAEIVMQVGVKRTCSNELQIILDRLVEAAGLMCLDCQSKLMLEIAGVATEQGLNEPRSS